MRYLLKTTAFAVWMLFANSYLAKAQAALSKYEIGITGGVFVYQGDLTPRRIGSYETARPQIALHVYRIISPSFSLRLNVNRGSLYGNDAKYSKPDWRQQRNFKFTTPVTEISTHIVWSFLAGMEPRFSPYLFSGVGITFLKINRDWSNINSTIFPEGSEVFNGLMVDAAKKTPRTRPVIPVGAGVRYELNDRFSLVGESAYRFIFTDYLDGFSQAANPKLDDHYLSHDIGVLYKFGKKDKKLGCPGL